MAKWWCSCNSMSFCVLGCMLACCFVLSCFEGSGYCLQHVFCVTCLAVPRVSSFPLTCKRAGSLQDGNSTTCVRASSTCQSIVRIVLWGVTELLYYFYYSYC